MLSIDQAPATAMPVRRLLANAPETDAAIAIAHRTPTLGVGCHLTLVDGTPLLPAAQIPTLAPDGRFLPTWSGFLAATWRRQGRFRRGRTRARGANRSHSAATLDGRRLNTWR